MSSFRSWSNNNNNTAAPAAATATEGSEQPSNPFGNMRRDRDRNRSSGMSYSDWKQTEQKKKVEDDKKRPLTDADFPPLSNKPVVVKNSIFTTTAHDSITLAERLRNTIKRQEDEAVRRRIEIEEEEKSSKEALVSLSLGVPMIRNRIQEMKVRRDLDVQTEEEYAWQVSSDMEAPAE